VGGRWENEEVLAEWLKCTPATVVNEADYSKSPARAIIPEDLELKLVVRTRWTYLSKDGRRLSD
jgi:hypothetical protein